MIKGIFQSAIAVVLLSSTNDVAAQTAPSPGPPSPFTVMQNPDADYFEILQHARDFYASSASDTSEDGPSRNLARWEWFWQNRVYRGDSIPGKFRYAHQALQNFVQTPVCPASNPICPSPCSTSFPITSNWTSLGPNTLPTQNLGMVWSVAVDPSDPNPTNPNVVYAGTSNSGLYRCTDFSTGSPNWVNITDGLRMPIGINQMVFDPANPNIMYLATGISRSGSYGIGILKTISASAQQPTWISPQTGLNLFAIQNKQVLRILIDPTSNPNSRIMYALVNDEIWKSYDSGDNWVMKFSMANIQTSWNPRQFTDLEMDPANPNIIYVGSKDQNGWNQNGAFLLKTRDGFETNTPSTFINLTPNIALPLGEFPTSVEVEISLADPGSIYVNLISDNSTAGDPTDDYGVMAKSTNGGLTFSSFLLSGNQAYARFEISSINANVMYFFSSVVLRKTVNGGTTIISPSGGYHVDVRDVLVIQETPGGTGDIVIQGNDGGISFGQFNNSTTSILWNNKNGTGLDIAQFFGFGGHDLQPDYLAGGTQDNGVVRLFGTWFLGNPFCDAYETAIDQNCPSNVYSEFACGWTDRSLIKSIMYGATSTWFSGGAISGDAMFNRPMQIHSGKDIYIGYRQVYKAATLDPPLCATVQSPVWNPIGPPGNTERVCAFEVAPSDNQVIYACYFIVASPLNNKIIFKSSNGGASWTELTANPATAATLFPLTYVPITDIAVNPQNPNELWITLGGFWSCLNDPGFGQNRVIHSIDGGLTFSDYSTGLPEFPVNAIVYEQGSNNGLYVGTDVGVFYRNASMCKWECFSTNLPVVLVTDLEINNCARKIRASTFGRGIWESDLATSAQVANITTNTAWSGNIFVPADVTISNNSTLTISGSTTVVNIALDKKFIIERGSKLVVDAATLTNACGEFWRGIEVWGNTGQSQHTPGAQGEVLVINNALIENSLDAITTIRTTPNGWDWNYTGGIVRCENSTFRNCKRSTQFLAYRNFNPNNPNITLSNLGYFKNCVFETTSFFNYNDFISPNTHISLFAVRGIQILGCRFTNTSSVPPSQNLRGKGITAIDAASLVVNDLSPTQPSVFSNLYHAIDASASNPLYTVIVRNSDFTNNVKGILLSGIDYATVVGNTVNLTPEFGSYGLYLNSCTKYLVENNSFNGLASGINIGIAVNNSGKLSNLIYNNIFKLCYVGSLCLNANDGPNIADGLRFNCNDYDNSAFDIAVSSFVPGSKIGLIQGICSTNPQTAVRNTYTSPNCSFNPEQHIYINNSVSFQPIFHGATQGGNPPYTDPVCSDPLVIGSICSQVFNRTTDCPSNICNPPNPPCLRLLVSDYEGEISSLLTRIDGGSTQGLLDSINSSMSPGNLKNILIAASPYLSDVVLIACINRLDMLPNGILKQIILANSPVTDTVMYAINHRNPELPSGIIGEINAAQTGTSGRELLEREIGINQSNRELTVDNLIRYFLTDTTVLNGIDSVIKILILENRPDDAKCEIIAAKIVAGDFAGAITTMDSIHATVPKDNFCRLLSTIIEIHTHLEKCFIMKTDTAIKSEIEFIAGADEKGCIHAQTFLTLVFDQVFPEEIIIPEIPGGLRSQEHNPTGNSTHSISYYPNPAKESVTFNFILPDITLNASLEIYDILGNKTRYVNIPKGSEEIRISTTDLNTGMYFFVLIVNGQFVERDKLLILK